MEETKVKVNLKGKMEKQEETSEMVPSVGASMQIDLEDAQTKWSIDYKKTDSLVLKLDGKVKIVGAKDVTLTGGTSITRDVFERSTTFEGMLEMEFNKNVTVELIGSTGPKESNIGANIQITF
jgi:hypothetical protein